MEASRGSVPSDPWWEQVALTPWVCWELWAGKDVCAFLSVVQWWAASSPLRWAHTAGWTGPLDGQRSVSLQGPEAGAADLRTQGSARGGVAGTQHSVWFLLLPA